MVIIDILAQATNGAMTGVAAGLGSAGMAMLLIKHMTNSSRHINGKKYQSRDVCEERSGNIKDTLNKMDEKLDKLLEDK